MLTPDENKRVVREAMVGSRFADVDWVASTGSTNTDLLAVAADPAGGEKVLATDFQAAGKGRRGRQWEAPAQAGLLVSILVRGVEGGAAHRITNAVGLAAIDACRAVADVDPKLKWPNDLLVDGRKLAGMLAEASFGEPATAATSLAAVVVGIGLNVNWAGAMPAELLASAVALDELAGHQIDRSQLLIALLTHLERWLDAPAGDVRRAYRQRSATIGQTVRIEQVGGHIIGEAIDVADDGQLIVIAGGKQQLISVGDVVHLRPA